jgi:phosphoribosylformimino-5-aminoimidazole carboxamide ribotide isomerase
LVKETIVQIIPVIDVLGGVVVRAKAGNRDSYQPISSKITSNVEPMLVIDDLFRNTQSSIFYIADLDAIINREPNKRLYQQLEQQFPHIEFWLDCGVRNQADLNELAQFKTIKPVIGTETLNDQVLVEALSEQNLVVLSLDYRNGKLISPMHQVISSQQWPQDVIVMSLDKVGMNAGPNVSLHKEIEQYNRHSRIYAAGGVRNRADLEKLEKLGVKGALLASALHDGLIEL